MDNGTVLELLQQAKISDVREVFHSYCRGAVRHILLDVMSEEVASLCGPRHKPSPECDYVRAGTSDGYVYLDSTREQVKRPRVRKSCGDGTTREVKLSSYSLAQDRQKLDREILNSLLSVGSGKKVSQRLPRQHGNSASSVSRLFQHHGRECFSQLRSRRLDYDENGKVFDWLALMIDGIFLAKELVAIVSVGITSSGNKVVLDFEIGSSESAETASNLLSRLKERGFSSTNGRALLAILDGSPALSKAVKSHFPSALIQRCLVHKERNLKSYLARKDLAAMSELTDRFRKSQGAQAGVLAYMELDKFLSKKNLAARESLHEAGLDLLTLHFLETPATLNRNLMSTNSIENVMLNLRSSSKHVCRWRGNTDQAPRWLAIGLLEAEKGFNRLSGYRELSLLAEKLSDGTYYKSLADFGQLLPGKLADLASAAFQAAPCTPQMQDKPLTNSVT